MKRIALYFGSFNPVHLYHTAIANHMIEHENFDEIHFVLSPQSPFKRDLVSFEHRAKMIELMLYNYSCMYLCEIEKDMPLPSYTVDTLRIISSGREDDEFILIMGMDNWVDIEKWKEFEYIIENYAIIVIPRIGTDNKLFNNKFSTLIESGKKIHSDTQLLKGLPLYELSSTYIRNEISEGRNVNPYLDLGVYSYIKNKGLYKK